MAPVKTLNSVASVSNWTAPFTFDLRSLAVFRIVLGVLILADLAFRFGSLSEMYTDSGFFTRELSFEYLQRQLPDEISKFAWSTYWLSGSYEIVVALFACSAMSAVLLTIGKWTRIATVASWVFLASLHIRNPLVTTSGDYLFKMMLFWSMFMPLGAFWSLDAMKKRIGQDSKWRSTTSYFSVATIGFVCQLMIAYFFPGLAKWNAIWVNGEAMSYVLRWDIYITEFGKTMLDFPFALKLISWLTLFFELIWIWTILIPWKNDWFRLSNLAFMWVFHLGIAVCMSIGLFPVICMVAWLPLVPAFVWGKPSGAPIVSWNWIRMSVADRLVQVFLTFVILAVVYWNVSNIEHRYLKLAKPELLTRFALLLHLDQHFQMFGVPPAINPWFVYEASLADGTQFDIFRNDKIQRERPDRVCDTFPSFHWRKLHQNIVHQQFEYLRQPLVDYMARKWNERNPPAKQIVRLRLLCFQEDIGPAYNQTDRHSLVWGSYVNQQLGAGSVFEAFSNDETDGKF
jgi:hypothetical protein